MQGVEVAKPVLDCQPGGPGFVDVYGNETLPLPVQSRKPGCNSLGIEDSFTPQTCKPRRCFGKRHPRGGHHRG